MNLKLEVINKIFRKIIKLNQVNIFKNLNKYDQK